MTIEERIEEAKLLTHLKPDAYAFPNSLISSLAKEFLKTIKELQQELADKGREIEGLKEALFSLISDDECRFDHNGNCQNHFTFENDGTCYNQIAKDLIDLEQLNKGE